MRYTTESFLAATDQEKGEEMERCRNPVYVYNTYFKTPEMPEMTEDQFIEMIAIGRLNSFKPRYPHLWPSKGLLEEERQRVRTEMLPEYFNLSKP